ncbi:MAG: heparan-alpha-glucosaminide N-acetyltransferase domain-containing protein [Clostridia bacterium]|nr:heparan-alpha-glucosaminide N-acetyltransferase domain-containing protein [Clostridia bacterium]
MMESEITLNLAHNHRRLWEFDYLRGLLLILVTVDHVCGYLPVFIHPENIVGIFLLKLCRDYTFLAAKRFVQPLVIFLFAYLSGINCNFTKDPIRRATRLGLITSVFMLCHQLGTLLFPSFFKGLFVFNILAVLTVCLFLWIPIKKYKVQRNHLIALGVLTTAVGLYFWGRLLFTEAYYNLPSDFRMFALFIYSEQGLHWSVDNFEPLLPSLGFFLLGSAADDLLFRKRYCDIPNRFLQPVVLLGRQSLVAYLFAPVVIIGFLKFLNLIEII